MARTMDPPLAGAGGPGGGGGRRRTRFRYPGLNRRARRALGGTASVKIPAPRPGRPFTPAIRRPAGVGDATGGGRLSDAGLNAARRGGGVSDGALFTATVWGRV